MHSKSIKKVLGVNVGHDGGCALCVNGEIVVAKNLKRPQSYISRVEFGEYRLDILKVKRFAKIYGKSVDYFVK